MKKLTFFSALFFICLCFFLGACTKNIKEESQKPSLISPVIKDFIDTSMKYDENAGMIFAFIDGDNVEYYSTGRLSKDNNAPINENSIFEIGSISKPFTASILAILESQNILSLDDPIETYLPKLVVLPAWKGNRITFKHVLNHSSGLPAMPANWTPVNPDDPYVDYDSKSFFDFLTSFEAPYELGTQSVYSNAGYGLLSFMIEHIQEKNYEELLKETITQPLNLDSTFITISDSEKHRFAKPHVAGEEVPEWTNSYMVGVYGIRSSAKDLVAFIQANMKEDSSLYNTFKPLHEKTLPQLITPGEYVGYGWNVHPSKEGDIIWHNGGTGGSRSIIAFQPQTQKGVVVLTNHAFDLGYTYRLAMHVLDTEMPKPEMIQYVHLFQKDLDPFTGTYTITKGIEGYFEENEEIQVSTINEKLTMQFPREPLYIFYAATPEVFVYEPFNLAAKFEKDETTSDSKLLFYVGEYELEAQKIQ